MKTNFTLLIADRNPHVRTFLQREMTAAGYRTRLAENARQVLKLAFKGEPLDMIILDPDPPEFQDGILVIRNPQLCSKFNSQFRLVRVGVVGMNPNYTALDKGFIDN